MRKNFNNCSTVHVYCGASVQCFTSILINFTHFSKFLRAAPFFTPPSVRLFHTFIMFCNIHFILGYPNNLHFFKLYTLCFTPCAAKFYELRKMHCVTYLPLQYHTELLIVLIEKSYLLLNRDHMPIFRSNPYPVIRQYGAVKSQCPFLNWG